MSRHSVERSKSPEQGFFRKLSVALLGDESPPPAMRAAAKRAGVHDEPADAEADGGGLWKRMSTALTDAFADDSGEDTPNAATDGQRSSARQSSIFGFFGADGDGDAQPDKGKPPMHGGARAHAPAAMDTSTVHKHPVGGLDITSPRMAAYKQMRSTGVSSREAMRRVSQMSGSGGGNSEGAADAAAAAMAASESGGSGMALGANAAVTGTTSSQPVAFTSGASESLDSSGADDTDDMEAPPGHLGVHETRFRVRNGQLRTGEDGAMASTGSSRRHRRRGNSRTSRNSRGGQDRHGRGALPSTSSHAEASTRWSGSERDVGSEGSGTDLDDAFADGGSDAAVGATAAGARGGADMESDRRNGDTAVGVARQGQRRRSRRARGGSAHGSTRSSHSGGTGYASRGEDEAEFDIGMQYQMIEAIGEGAYGTVIAAQEVHPSGQAGDASPPKRVAIKKIHGVFQHRHVAVRTLREIALMRMLPHENIIRVLTILQPKDPAKFMDLYLVLELMETDLSSVIRSPQPFSDSHVQFFVYQILRGLKWIHTANVIHRDLKPRNILVNANCDLKICDFGLARVDFAERQHRVAQMTDYVASRWYRAPEVLLTWKKYTKAIDMWSVGCILAELLGREPIFPGSDSRHQLDLITQILGSPSEHAMANIKDERTVRYLRRLPQRDAMDFSELHPDANPDAVDFLEKLLEFDPADRITVEESLAHPYLKGLRYPDDEPANAAFGIDQCPFEKADLSMREIRALILQEIGHYHTDGPSDDVGVSNNGLDSLSRTNANGTEGVGAGSSIHQQE